jgi:hypothetical protein
MNRYKKMLLSRLYRQPTTGEGDGGSQELGTGFDKISDALNGVPAAPIESPVAPSEPPVIEPPLTPDASTSENEAKLLKEVMKRKAKEQEQIAEIASLKEQITQFADINVEEVKAMLATKKDADVKRLEDQGAWDSLKIQMKDEQSKIVKQKDDLILELQSKLGLQNAAIDKLTLGSAFENSKFIDSELALPSSKAKIIYGDYFEIKGDKIVGYNKSSDHADRAMLVNVDGDSLAFEDAIKKIIDADPDRDMLIKSKSKQGSNSITSNATVEQAKPVLVGMDRILSALNSVKK